MTNDPIAGLQSVSESKPISIKQESLTITEESQNEGNVKVIKFKRQKTRSDFVDNRSYKCNVCGNKFHQSYTLLRHKKQGCSGPGKHKCQICDNTFHQTYNLDKHMISHGEKKNKEPLVCDFCPKVFFKNCERERHHRVHTGERPFKCSRCPMAFKRRSHMLKHKEQHKAPSQRVKVETNKGPKISNKTRWMMAFLGGMLMGYGARLARGCTSGQALSGGAVLSVGSWAFMFAVFAGAYALAYFLRRYWN